MIADKAFLIGGQSFIFSPHAVERILDMRLDPAEVRACLERPNHRVKSIKYQPCENWQYGEFTLGIRPDGDTLVIITAVWSSREAWAADFAIGGYVDRELRATYTGPRSL